MEAETISSFLPELVTAVSDSVLSVLDQCLAKGLINETVYKRVLESGGTSEDKARTLILAVKKSTETDSRCLEILLNILDQELPFAIRENLLSKIRKELTDKANTSRAVVPLSKAVQQVPLGELSKETTLQQSSLLGRFEDSIRQHEHACAEKKLLEERLKVKSETREKLKGEPGAHEPPIEPWPLSKPMSQPQQRITLMGSSEGEVINSFLPDLVTAVSDSVLSVSDQCLANGLINETVYKRVLESGGTSDDKARTLILAVKKSTETDSRCLEILLNILDQELPFVIKENLLSKLRKELTEKANTSRAVVPLSKIVELVPLVELSKETTLQQSALLERYKDSIRQHEQACAEKKLLEERLKVKSERYETLKGELETLKGQSQKLASNTQGRKTADTKQIEEHEKRIEELQKTIEEQSMQARRRRNMIITESRKMFVQLAQQSHQEMQTIKDEHRTALIEAKTLAMEDRHSQVW